MHKLILKKGSDSELWPFEKRTQSLNCENKKKQFWCKTGLTWTNIFNPRLWLASVRAMAMVCVKARDRPYLDRPGLWFCALVYNRHWTHSNCTLVYNCIGFDHRYCPFKCTNLLITSITESLVLDNQKRNDYSDHRQRGNVCCGHCLDTVWIEFCRIASGVVAVDHPIVTINRFDPNRNCNLVNIANRKDQQGVSALSVAFFAYFQQLECPTGLWSPSPKCWQPSWSP